MLQSIVLALPSGQRICPEIGVATDVPDAMLPTLQREWFTLAKEEQRGDAPPEPHLAGKIKPVG